MSRREDVFKDIDDTNTQTLSDLQQAIEPQACIDMYNKYKDLRLKTFDDAFDNEFIKRHAYTPTRYEYIIYDKVCGISDIIQKDRVFHRVVDIMRDNLNAIHDEYNRITSIALPILQREGDEHIKEKILGLAINTYSSRSLSQKQLLKAIEQDLNKYPHTLTPEQMHEFYKRNITQYQTLKSSPKPKPKAKPKQPKDKQPHELQAQVFNGSPWSSYTKHKAFISRNKVNEEVVEEQRYINGPNAFNIKKQRKLMKHMYAPRHTFIIDYFFPGKYMYLLAINVNTRKAYYCIPKEIKKTFNGWSVPLNPKANSDSAIESLKDLMQQTTVKGLIMDQEPAWQYAFHAFCNANGIAWRHYIKNNIKGLIETNDTSRGNHSTLALIDRLCATLRRMHFNMGGGTSIDPDQMKFLIDEYNASPHATLSSLLNKPTSPNMVDNNFALEDAVVLKIIIENASIDMDDDYDIIGQKVRIMNESSKMDKLKHKLLPGIWDVVSKDHGLFVCKQGSNTIKVSRWMITPIA